MKDVGALNTREFGQHLRVTPIMLFNVEERIMQDLERRLQKALGQLFDRQLQVFWREIDIDALLNSFAFEEEAQSRHHITKRKSARKQLAPGARMVYTNLTSSDG